MMVNQDPHLLQIRQEFMFTRTADLAAGAALTFSQAFSRNYLAD
jgi:hypothetical protein